MLRYKLTWETDPGPVRKNQGLGNVALGEGGTKVETWTHRKNSYALRPITSRID